MNKKIRRKSAFLTAGLILAASSLGFGQGAKENSPISGSFLFITESSGYGPGEGVQILLKFVPPDILTIAATKPGTPSVTDEGHFFLEGGRITLSLPGLGRSAEKSPYSFDGRTLVLPILIIDDGSGTSTWEKVEEETDPAREAIRRFREGILQGQPGSQSLAELRRDLLSSPDITGVDMGSGRTLLIRYSSGYQEFFLTSGITNGASGRPSAPPVPSRIRPKALPLPFNGAGFLAGQFLLRPGGQREGEWYTVSLKYEPEPVSSGDAPPDRTAVLLSAFHTLPILVPGGDGLKYFTFKDKGENLDAVTSPLRKAGYSVTGPIIDAAVGVGKIWEVFNKSWGVVYFSSHGGILPNGDFLLSTGEQVPAGNSGSAKARQAYLKRHLDDLARTAGFPSHMKAHVLVGFINDDIPFIAVTSELFKHVRGDFSRSLIYISGCDAAKTDRLRAALNPRAYAGWLEEVDMELGGDFLEPFWKVLSLKTRSAREAMDYTKNFLLEKKGYTAKLRAYGRAFDPNLFALFRQGKPAYEKNFTRAMRRMITAVRETAWLKKKSTGKEELLAITDQLYRCTPHDFTIAGNPFCKKAFAGGKAPDAEIDETKGELCGYGGSTARFTLVER